MTTPRASEDWRLAPGDLVARLLEAERQRWITELHWDARPAFELLERSRQAGTAPGLVASDGDGRVVGWAHYFLHNRRLQIGGLVAESGEVTRQLLDDVLRTPEAELASDILCFAFPSSPALEGALTRRRFEVTRYLYLQRALSPAQASMPAAVAASSPTPVAAQLRGWTEDDAVDTVRLFARAYAGSPAARAFAPRGTLEEWAQYVAQIIKTPGCGRFLPAASVAVQHPADDRLRGLVLTTTLQRDTAHIAQLVVDPAYRRRGLARALVDDASRRAGAAGCWRVTLLVAEDNTPARDLYAGLGFETAGSFLYATRQAPNRLRGQSRAKVPAQV
jgi:ribosomal protein S18 acetylase RimI-like enzyme